MKLQQLMERDDKTVDMFSKSGRSKDEAKRLGKAIVSMNNSMSKTTARRKEDDYSTGGTSQERGGKYAVHLSVDPSVANDLVKRIVAKGIERKAIKVRKSRNDSTIIMLDVHYD